jgi:hypothetical protein
MIAITCYLADFNLIPGFPVISDLTLKGRTVENYFREASGIAAIEIIPDFSRRNQLPELVNPIGVYPDQLMEGLIRLFSTGISGEHPCMGLLIADTYAPSPGMFGLMFDVNGQDGVIGSRQGCAIFLSAIAQALPDGFESPGASEFISFIAIHEIGHALNLWHIEGSSLMQPHPNPGDLGSCTFDAMQCKYLSLAGNTETAKFVLPGAGCSPYGLRPNDPDFPKSDDQPFASPEIPGSGLALHIGLSNVSFWPFEPLELDVNLSVRKAFSKVVQVPDELDPGYTTFQIWITGPDGVQYPYRAAARYCGQSGMREITTDRPFMRDIAITRQSHGYTFTLPGRYQIQAYFRTAPGRYIKSNIVECEVKPPISNSVEWTHAMESLDTFEAQRLFQYKRRLPSHSAYAKILQFADRHASEATAAAINYALGKAATSSWKISTASHAIKLRDLGIVHLRKAVDSGKLHKHRKQVVSNLLEGLSNN